MSDCGVCIGDGDIDGFAEFCDITRPKARKDHHCEECGRVIPKGAVYVRHVGKFDGDLFCVKTCVVCNEIADAFSCEYGVAHGQLWSEMEAVFSRLTTTCFDKLSTSEAKTYLRQRWMQWRGLLSV